jgi:hypothetical protein
MYRVPLLVAIIFSAGCASIVSNKVYPVQIASDPSGARFTVSNRNGLEVQSGTTPQVINLEASSGYFKGETYKIVLTKDGFDDKIYTVTSSVDGWYWGNILIGGLIGMLIVDPITGAMYKLPERVDVSLTDSAARNAQDDIDIVFASIDSLNDEQRSRLQTIR